MRAPRLLHFSVDFLLPKDCRFSGMSEGNRIQFDDAIHPVVSHGGGVYNLRDRSRTGSNRSQSLSRHEAKEYDLEKEISNVDDRDIKKKQVRSSTSCYG